VFTLQQFVFTLENLESNTCMYLFYRSPVSFKQRQTVPSRSTINRCIPARKSMLEKR